MRQPAASQSVFGMRPSRGALSIEGTVVISQLGSVTPASIRKCRQFPEYSDLDAIGVLSKDLEVLSRVSSQLFRCPTKHPTITASLTQITLGKLIYPSHLFPIEDEAAQSMYDRLVVALENITGSEKVVIDFREEWKHAQDFTKEEYEEYFKEVS